MGKPVQQSDIDFIMRKYGTFTIIANHPNLANVVPDKITGQILAKTPTPLWESVRPPTRVDSYDCMAAVWNPYGLYGNCMESVRSVRPSSAVVAC